MKTKLEQQNERSDVLNLLLQSNSPILSHYENLLRKYSSTDEITKAFHQEIVNRIDKNAANDNHYKYYIYKRYNPSLTCSTFIYCNHKNGDLITKFRLGTHHLPLKQADGAEHRETYGCVNRVMFWAMKNILYTPVVIHFAMTCNFTISR